MQNTWERRHNLIQLDIAAITDLVEPMFPGQRVVSVRPISGGLINTNYKIRVAGWDEAFVLRIYVRDRDACQKEVDIFHLVHERVPMAEFLYADTEGVRCGQPYVVMRWVEGVMLKEVLAKDSSEDIGQVGYAVGAVLAHISSYTFPRAGFFGHGIIVEQPMVDIADYIGVRLRGKAGERLGDEMTRRVWRLVEDNKEQLSEVKKSSSLVHSDFQPTNVLVREEAERWKVAAVLDWEWAHAGSTLLDIGILLRHDKQLPPMFEPRFIDGFVRHGGKLPAEWKKLSKLVDLVNLCEFLNGPEERKNLMDDVKRIMIQTVEDWG